MLPEKVLVEYTGDYKLDGKGTDYERILNTFLGGPYEKVIVKVEQADGRLYLTTTAAPKAELFWKAKDQFDASFCDTQLYFGRDETGKVISVRFLSREGQEIKGVRA